MAFSDKQLRYFWRTKYPWLFVFYILAVGIIRGIISTMSNQQLAIDILMIAAFTSYIFLYVFYLYGVRPLELEHHFHKRK
jgi:hypothetical protein